MAASAMTGVVGSAIGAGASLIGGASSTAMQNHANKEIAQMNNAFNEKMFDKQVAYNKEMYQQQLGDQWKFYNDAKQNSWDLYNDQKEYNSASAQRERLEAAGLNPYLMMSGGSAGVAQGGSSPSGGAPSAQGVTPPTATPYSADYSGVTAGLGRAIDLLASMPDRKVKEAQADNLRIEGKYIAGKAIAQILQMRTEAKTKEARLALDRLIADFDNNLKVSNMAVNDQNIAESKARTQLSITENLMRRKELDFLPQAQKLQLAQGAADIALKYSQKKLTDEQAKHEVQKLSETIARTELTNQQYWTEQANTVNAQLQNTRNQIENQFTSETYKTRVRLIEESLFDAIYNTDKIGIFKTGARFLQSLGVKP
ncbi:hypothetical protein [Bacteroides stercoris]|uniref:hypothetical protein n=1 Tax=Bacteroides stercoris TaxID=46506 RepID=UPI0022E55A26|nr:hypothetical protein [Bacteroides stercoris]